MNISEVPNIDELITYYKCDSSCYYSTASYYREGEDNPREVFEQADHIYVMSKGAGCDTYICMDDERNPIAVLSMIRDEDIISAMVMGMEHWEQVRKHEVDPELIS